MVADFLMLVSGIEAISRMVAHWYFIGLITFILSPRPLSANDQTEPCMPGKRTNILRNRMQMRQRLLAPLAESTRGRSSAFLWSRISTESFLSPAGICG